MEPPLIMQLFNNMGMGQLLSQVAEQFPSKPLDAEFEVLDERPKLAMDVEVPCAAQKEEIGYPCPVCGDKFGGTQNCCDKCMNELVGI